MLLDAKVRGTEGKQGVEWTWMRGNRPAGEGGARGERFTLSRHVEEEQKKKEEIISREERVKW